MKRGTPTSINGEKMKVSDIIRKLNELGGKHGIGIVDIVENRVVGMKSRGVYETPGGTILYEAHQQLEELILDREDHHHEAGHGQQIRSDRIRRKMVHPSARGGAGLHREDPGICDRRSEVQAVQGQTLSRAGTTSPYSLYNESIASFTTGDLYDHHDAEGFINLFGLSSKVRAMKHQELEKAGK